MSNSPVVDVDPFEKQQNGPRRRSVAEESAEYLDGAAQVAEIVEEVVGSMITDEAKAAVELGYRTWPKGGPEVMEPWVVDGLIGKRITTTMFRRMVKAAMDSDNASTTAFRVRNVEYNGDWVPYVVKTSHGKDRDVVLKLDGVRAGLMDGITGEAGGIVKLDDSNQEESTPVRKRVVQWAVGWVDVKNEPWIKRDRHGREADQVDVTVQGANVAPLAEAVRDQTAMMGKVVDQLAAATSNEGKAPKKAPPG